jgi:hypothetical protein
MGAATEQSRVLGRLRSLAEAGVLADLTVRTWPGRVTTGDDLARCEFALCREFQAWADDRGVRLAPAFESHDCHNSYTNTRYTTTVLPVICLALYDEDDLLAVYPHSGPHGVRTVLDGISVLEAESEPIAAPRPASNRPPRV